MKTSNHIIITVLLALASQALLAQHARFVESGVITYEKRVNMYAKIENRLGNSPFMEQAFEQYKQTRPQFKSFNYSLAFNGAQTLFKPQTRTAAVSGGFFDNDPSIDIGSTIFTDLAARQGTAQKSIYEETYLVTDSIRHIQWRITNELREIAGYQCRRANALVLDSIYVVAFYTDQIPVSGGPESFTGLPGMILGVALPYENTTWFATDVVDRQVTAEELKAPQKGNTVSYAELRAQLEASLKNWGEYAQSILKAMLL